MKYNVFFTEEANRDLNLIKSYSLDPNVALKYIQNIIAKVEQLESFPNLGLEVKNQTFEIYKLRYLIVANHIVYYRINEASKSIYVMGIVAQTSNWKVIVNKDYVSPSIIIARSERLTIKTMDTNMYYDVWRNSLDLDNKRFVPDEVFDTLEEASDVVNSIIECYESEDGPFVYAVIRNEDKANIGYVQLVKIEEGWEIGYHIAKRYTGNGYATEAVKLFLEYLKTNTKIDKVYGVALADNKASRKVLNKCGFELYFEGKGIYQGHKKNIIKSIKSLR